MDITSARFAIPMPYPVAMGITVIPTSYWQCKLQNTLIPTIMYRFIKTNSAHPDFIKLVQQLDADLAERDGAEHAFYQQFNGIQQLNHVVVLYDADEPIGCGAFKEIEKDTVEVKRMYTLPAHRSKGHASNILNALEQWAKEEGYSITVLETGKRQPEAIELYKKNGYNIIPNYGQYMGIENSVCFRKKLPFI